MCSARGSSSSGSNSGKGRRSQGHGTQIRAASPDGERRRDLRWPGEKRHAHAIFHRRSGARHGDVAWCRHGLEGGGGGQAKVKSGATKWLPLRGSGSEWGEEELVLRRLRVSTEVASDGSLIQKRMLSRAPQFPLQKEKDTQNHPR